MNTFLRTVYACRILVITLIHICNIALGQDSATVIYDSNSTVQFYPIEIMGQAIKVGKTGLFVLRPTHKYFRIPIEQVRNIRVYNKNVNYHLYIFPGDTLIIGGNENTCVFKGTRENEYNLSETLINHHYPFYTDYWNFKSVPYKEYLTYGRSELRNALQKIDYAADSLNLSSEFVLLLKRDMNCAFIRSFIRHHEKYLERDQNSEKEILGFVESFGTFFENDSLRNSIIFNYALISWSQFLARASNNFQKPEKTNTYIEFAAYDAGENYLQRLDMAKSMSKNNRQDIMYSILSLKFGTNTWNGQEYKPYLSYFESVCTNLPMIEKIRGMAGTYMVSPSTEITNKFDYDPEVANSELLTKELNRIRWKDIVKSHSGQVIYIDFWASWCAPCIKELKKNKVTVDSLNRTGKIKILAISLDEDKTKWDKAIKMLNIERTFDHYIMSFDSALGKLLLRDRSVPQYIIIDKKGKLRTMTASAISTNKGGEALMSLLNN